MQKREKINDCSEESQKQSDQLSQTPKKIFTLKISVFLNCVLASIYIVFGLVILIIGALMKPDETKFVLNMLKDRFKDFTSEAHVLSNIFIAVGVISVIGGIVILATWLYTCCSRHQNNILIIICIIFVVATFVTKIPGFVLLKNFESKIEEQQIVKTDLIGSLHTNFVGDSISGGNDISNEWNKMFIALGCCAVNSVDSSTNDFDKTPWCTTSGECQMTNAEIPKTCCLGVTEDNYTSAPRSCYSDLKRGTYNEKGCFKALKEMEDKMREKITNHKTIVFVIGTLLFIVEVCSVTFVIIICRQSNPSRHKSKSKTLVRASSTDVFLIQSLHKTS